MTLLGMARSRNGDRSAQRTFDSPLHIQDLTIRQLLARCAVEERSSANPKGGGVDVEDACGEVRHHSLIAQKWDRLFSKYRIPINTTFKLL